MNKKWSTLRAYTVGNIVFDGHPSVHPFALLIEDFLSSVGIAPADVRKIDPDIVSYNFGANGNRCNHFSLYKKDGEIWIFLQCCVGTLPKGREGDLALRLLKEHNTFYFPERITVNDLKEENLSVVSVEFRSFSQFLTHGGFLIRIENILTVAGNMHEKFTKEDLLLTLPRDWFERATCH